MPQCFFRKYCVTNVFSARKTLFVSSLVSAFLGAFLLFLVQPLLSKLILPWFGGNQSVWIVSMLFYQVMLLAGYAYAHLLTKYVPSKVTLFLHLVLVLASLIFLPILPNESWKAVSATAPTSSVLLLLVSTVGLPYLVLGSTAPLLQVWLARTAFSNPYQLYAVSNAASVGALLSFPFFFEPNLSGADQVFWWSRIFVVYLALLLLAGLSFRRASQEIHLGATPNSAAHKQVPFKFFVFWCGLSFLGVLLLLSISSAITQDIAVVPLFWVIPLSLYLLSFVLCFGKSNWYRRTIYGYLFILALLFWAGLQSVGASAPLLVQLAIYSFLLFAGCMVCHGELVRLKPENHHLTSFYLFIAFGGALGGVFAGVLAPLLFSSLLEFYFAIFAVLALTCYFICFQDTSLLDGRFWLEGRFLVLVGITLFGLTLYLNNFLQPKKIIHQNRNFFGAIKVVPQETDSDERKHYVLYNGRISHGVQFLAPDRKNLPTSYYAPTSGVGLLLKSLPQDSPLRLGVIGLGVGTLAAYAKPGDYVRFYEINPEVEKVAKEYFSYLVDSQAKVDVVLGDARLSLENEPSQKFDVLVVDAFTGDAIPVHLLTREALRVYLKHLKPKGIIAFHITNIHLDLRYVVYGLAQEHQLITLLIKGARNDQTLTFSSTWILASRDGDALASEKLQQASEKERLPSRDVRVWTDDYSNLLQVLK